MSDPMWSTTTTCQPHGLAAWSVGWLAGLSLDLLSVTVSLFTWLIFSCPPSTDWFLFWFPHILSTATSTSSSIWMNDSVPASVRERHHRRPQPTGAVVWLPSRIRVGLSAALLLDGGVSLLCQRLMYRRNPDQYCATGTRTIHIRHRGRNVNWPMPPD